MLMNLLLVSLSMLNIFRIDAAIVIFLVLCINFAKINTNNELVFSITLLFSMMLSLVNIFH